MRALIWDVDGTLAETERDGHRVAFNQAFAAFGLPWHWDVDGYRRRLAVTGGRERLHAELAARADAPPAGAARDALVDALHAAKNRLYGDLVASGAIALRPGVAALFDACRDAGVAMAIATTTSRANVDALLRAHDGPRWHERFAAVVCGEDVRAKKPDPEVYLVALRRLGVAAGDCLAIEDAPAGVAAARAAGVPVVVVRSAEFAAADISGAVAVGPGFETRRGWQPPLDDAAAGAIGLAELQRWWSAAATR